MRLAMRASLFAGLLCALFLASPLRAGGSVVYMPLVFSTASVEEVNILPGHSSYPGEYTWDGHTIHYVRFIGEITNESERDLREVRLKFRLYNGAHLVHEFTDIAPLRYHPAGETTCFGINLYDEVPAWDRYEVAVHTHRLVLEPRGVGSPAIRDLREEWQGRNYRIQGTLENDTGLDINDVAYVASLYDASGQLVQCGYDHSRIGALPRGSIETFVIPFGSARDYTLVRSFKVQITGYTE